MTTLLVLGILVVSFVLGATLSALGLLVVVTLRSTIPAKDRGRLLAAWIKRPLPDPSSAYRQQNIAWSKQLVHGWFDREWAEIAVRNFLLSDSDEATERLERELERSHVEYRGIPPVRVSDSLRRYYEAEIDRIFRRSPTCRHP